MRVALVHYWLVTMRGGESVLEALCEMFPEADIYTHVYVPQAVSPVIRRHRVVTSFIQRLPFAATMYQRYLPLMPFALEQFDLRGYDLVISTESGPAKGVLTSAETPHICYCHTPMRYLWDYYQEYLASAGLLSRLGLRYFSYGLRQWDVLSANRVDHFVANSHNVARRIKKHYRREADVVYPPVDLDFFSQPAEEGAVPGLPLAERPYLFLGQLLPYKRADLAVDACVRLKRPLVVVGEGPEQARLQARAGKGVLFTGKLDREALRARMRECRGLIFPGEEDFGIVPLEAQAAGVPVIAYGRGGALETVREGKTGLFFEEQSVDSLVKAVQRFEEMEFDPAAFARHVGQFSRENFRKGMQEVLALHLGRQLRVQRFKGTLP